MNVTRRRRWRGQAAVETALVMPLFVFYVMATLQLSLLHQARQITKYAAFKAARVGSIHSAKMKAMEQAALGVVLPFAGTGDAKGVHVYKTGTATDYGTSYQMARANVQEGGLPIVEVTICNPTKKVFNSTGATNMDLDNAAASPMSDTSWKKAWATRLNIQVTFYHRMVIPFANGMLWWMAMAKEDHETLRLLRMGSLEREAGGGTNAFGNTTQIGAAKKHPQEWTLKKCIGAAQSHEYIMPVRASYGMRMQSNLLPNQSGFELPDAPKCHVTFDKNGSDADSSDTGDDTEHTNG